MKNIDLVILAGGKGSRIKKFLNNSPKPMAKINEIYFLQYLINNFSKYPINKIYILTGYKNEIIFKNFHNKIFNFIKIICIRENKPMGTGGALFQLRKKVKDFILVNGDTVFDINLNDFVKSYKKNLGCVALTPNNRNIHNYKLNNLSVKNNSLIYKKNS